MAFRSIERKQRKPQWTSLIDMAFILVIFFAVTNIVVKMKKGEANVSVPLPKNQMGRAQVLIQLDGERDLNGYYFIDPSAADRVDQILNNFGYLAQDQIQRKVIEYFQTRFFSKDELMENIEMISQRAQSQSEEYFFLIRCPESMPYYHVIDIIQKISRVSEIDYGCVEGSFDDIRNARIATYQSQNQQGLFQNNLVITFRNNAN